jgi:hypothetical protein
MTERWQRELKKLGGVQMPPSVGPRIEEGPTGYKLPARRQRIVAGVVAFAVFGAAGGFAFQALRNRTPATGASFGRGIAVLDLHGSSDLPPTASLTFGSTTRNAFLGRTCWMQIGSLTGSCPDTLPDSLTQSDYVTVPFGTKIEAQGNATSVELGIFYWNPGPGVSQVTPSSGEMRDLGFLNDPVPLYEQPGNYILTVLATWGPGRAWELYFAIRILPTS